MRNKICDSRYDVLDLAKNESSESQSSEDSDIFFNGAAVKRKKE